MPSDARDRAPAGGGPLAGIVVLDLSRMLPGAVLARVLLDLGARWIKIEEPGIGDPLRAAPPAVAGVGAGFRRLLAGAESATLDLRDPHGARAVRRIARHVDVVVESFRPGTLARWGIDPQRLTDANPRLVICSLSSFGQHGPDVAQVGHDLNFTARSGLLELLPGDGIPRVQIVDVGAALLASSAILAALVERGRTGRGRIVDQPLASGAGPFVAWVAADRAAGGGGLDESILSGRAPSYRLYHCADGARIAVAVLEPKFWSSFLAMLEVDGLEDAGLDVGEAGARAGARIAEVLARRERVHWLALARHEPRVWFAHRDAPDARPAPALGAHTAAVLAEFGVEPAD